ncbi:GIY-YIG nuclease family protein [Patescibacteria group bacterium]|nr:GIY-YIG nuclease family protein [Patescibacteria group bacterium]
MTKSYYVYFMASQNNRALYIGITNDLKRRVFEHKNELINGFTRKYKCKKLIYYEETSDVKSAITREKVLKKWRRQKKEELINEFNPKWKDLSENL